MSPATVTREGPFFVSARNCRGRALGLSAPLYHDARSLQIWSYSPCSYSVGSSQPPRSSSRRHRSPSTPTFVCNHGPFLKPGISAMPAVLQSMPSGHASNSVELQKLLLCLAIVLACVLTSFGAAKLLELVRHGRARELKPEVRPHRFFMLPWSETLCCRCSQVKLCQSTTRDHPTPA